MEANATSLLILDVPGECLNSLILCVVASNPIQKEGRKEGSCYYHNSSSSSSRDVDNASYGSVLEFLFLPSAAPRQPKRGVSSGGGLSP